MNASVAEMSDDVRTDVLRPIRAVIVDDDETSRRVIIHWLKTFPEVEILGQADSCYTARPLIESLQPNTLFLDINMPGSSGFDLISSLKEKFKIVFVTAEPNHAALAFDVDAVDYVVKPVSRQRIAKAIGKILASLQLDDRNASAPSYVAIGQQHTLIPVDSIMLIRADGHYTIVYAEPHLQYRIKRSLAEWIKRLPPSLFLKVHRNYLVQKKHILKMDSFENHDLLWVQHQENPIPISRRHVKVLREILLHYKPSA